MNRQVIVLPRAESQLLEASLWWSENRSMEQALRWLAGFEEALSLLETDIRKLTIAPKDELLDIPFTIRQLTYGLGNPPTHRAIIELREPVIYIHAIRHLAQDEISLGDI